jgi:hypothetical protein
VAEKMEKLKFEMFEKMKRRGAALHGEVQSGNS